MILRILGGAAVALAGLGLAVRLLHSSWQPLVILATFAPYLLVFALIGLAVVGVARWRIGIALALVVGVVAVGVEAPVFVAASVPQGTPLTVMQANLRLGSADAAALIKQAAHVDVLTVEELTPPELGRLAGLTAALPYRFVFPTTGGAGVGLWSRYPLSVETFHLGFVLHVLSATVTIAGRSVTLVAAHIIPPYPGSPSSWIHELDTLRDLLQSLTGPVIVGGDFNSTLDLAPFRSILAGGYHDAAEQSGSGLVRTFPGNRWFPPLIGIDHIIVRGAVARSVDVLDLAGSDHRGLLGRLVLPTRTNR